MQQVRHKYVKETAIAILYIVIMLLLVHSIALAEEIAEVPVQAAEASAPAAEISVAAAEASVPAAEASEPAAEVSEPVADESVPVAEVSELIADESVPAGEVSVPSLEASASNAESLSGSEVEPAAGSDNAFDQAVSDGPKIDSEITTNPETDFLPQNFLQVGDVIAEKEEKIVETEKAETDGTEISVAMEVSGYHAPEEKRKDPDGESSEDPENPDRQEDSSVEGSEDASEENREESRQETSLVADQENAVTFSESGIVGYVLQAANEGIQKAVRTIMTYISGSDLETKFGMASNNLQQILDSSFSEDDQVRVIVMTGGSDNWHMDSKYLYDPETGEAPEGGISSKYNQVWEARGQNAAENPGKLVLLDGDGLRGDGENAVPAEDSREWMTNPEVLLTFINYCAENYPAEKYDLILWSHGYGVAGGFGSDDHDRDSFVGGETISSSEFIEALKDSAVEKFDFIDFDACLMNSVELGLALADYADYYIASAETEPGYGQSYTGWLNALGEDPDMNGFELGKIIVDDYYDLYSVPEDNGAIENATLAVIDLQKLKESGLPEAMTALADTMIAEATTVDDEYNNLLYYDELNAFYNAIRYSGTEYSDLGNVAQLISIVLHEIESKDVTSGDPKIFQNAYLKVAQQILDLLADRDMIYTRATESMSSKDGRIFRESDETVRSDFLESSGIQVFFPNIETPGKARRYAEELEALEKLLLSDDSRGDFLSRYADAVRLYSVIPMIGQTVDELVERGADKASVNVSAVKNAIGDSRWDTLVVPLLNNCFGGEEAAAAQAWLESIITQQTAEAVDLGNVTAEAVRAGDRTGYRILIDDTRQRVIDSVRINAVLEFPAFEKYLEEHPDIASNVQWVRNQADIPLDFITGTLEFDDAETDDGWLADIVRLYNNDSCIWNLSPLETKWYAVEDAAGQLLVAAAGTLHDTMAAPFISSNADGTSDIVFLGFRDGELAELSYLQNSGVLRTVPVSELKEDLSLIPVMYVDFFGMEEYFLPISEAEIFLTPETVDSFRLVYTDIENIPDIGDTDGDGKPFREKVVLRDIYHHEWDLTSKTQNPSKTWISIGTAEIPSVIYNGEEQIPQVIVDGVVLTPGVDYTWEKYNKNDDFTNVGTYEIVLNGLGLQGSGSYVFTALKEFEIKPKPGDPAPSPDDPAPTSGDPASIDPSTRKQVSGLVVKGTVENVIVIEYVSKVVSSLSKGKALDAMKENNAVFAAAFNNQNGEVLDSGMVNFGGVYDNAQEDMILVPSDNASYVVNKPYTVVLNNGTVQQVTCTEAGLLWIPIPKDAAGIGYVVLLGTIESSQVMKQPIAMKDAAKICGRLIYYRWR